MSSRTISATQLKAHCLALLDEVSQGGHSITVTKRGRAVARLEPVRRAAWKSPAGSWSDRVKIAGDIVGFDSSRLWDALRKA